MSRKTYGYTLYLDRTGLCTSRSLTAEIGDADTWVEIQTMARTAAMFENPNRLWVRDEARGHRLTMEQVSQETDPHESDEIKLNTDELATLAAAEQVLGRHGRPPILTTAERMMARARDAEAADNEVTQARTEDAKRGERGSADPPSENRRALEWLLSDDTGWSSMTIAAVMLNLPTESLKRKSIPYDSGDLGRCLRLLEKIPEWNARLDEVGVIPRWEPLIDRWSELKRVYAEESAANKVSEIAIRHQRMNRTDALISALID